MEECLNTMPHKVTSEMQEYLSRDYSADEIKAALFQMGTNKGTWTRWYECSLLPKILVYSW